MTADHVSQVAALEAICFHDPWSEKSVASELTNPLSLWLVALDGDRVAGYVGSQSVLGESDMMNVAVHPDYRRQGIAEKLCLALVQALKEKGNHCLTLEVRTSNDPAKALYEKLGFQQIGLRKNYYRNPREDACILRKEF
jgi:ribosomal-protein-alanine N-acetyltransferase